MSTNIRNLATRLRLPSTSLRHSLPTHRVLGRRTVGGTSVPKPDAPPNGPNLPVIVGAVAAVAGATYLVTRSSKERGVGLANEAREIPHSEKLGRPGQPGNPERPVVPGGDNVADGLKRSLRADAPKTAYKAEEERAPKGTGVDGQISQRELSESVNQSLKTDAPKTAYKAEEEFSR